ncbi:ribulose bisphosphate carboxylase small subunit [Merismopedia glauca]|uniref:Ribulose 1,5-bisphosphate carboxylase n=1 Tax=Merismopedia glauca CCAP 1448/3 TaxID=1296344 RepID=A0A2T1C2C0_9CYAN|nr:ribulose bisphosphate carboxylase small subunit [Merismopedia glauca]PSB02411.1 ribulose 1,5-bisphosphate carboxylase [Merismopedia glauca CCAP 1448/3]
MTYYISPRFLDKVAIHITKNFLELPDVKVPLILGVHGRKGEGKSFQCELVFQRMGVEVVRMSAGELESPDAGDPARLIRLRYREVAELIRVRGKMCVLLINDFDAGAGRFDGGTQYTVNTQLVHGTLMNIADHPTDVQLPGSYDATPLHRVPIILTGNDFSTLYAPLIRDGRMEKFYWEPDRADKLGIVGGIFAPDDLSPSDVERLVDTFPNQAIDFFSALRARLYDEQIRYFIHDVGIDRVSSRVVNSRDRPPEFHKPDFSLAHLVEIANLIVKEQQQVYKSRLVEEYSPHRYTVPSQNTPVAAASPTKDAATSLGTSSLLSPDIESQVREAVDSGYKLGLECADERRFKSSAWQSCDSIDTSLVAEAISAVADCLAQHPKEYIRLIAIDPHAKRRVRESIIQRPN